MSAPMRLLFIVLTLIIACSVFTDYFIPGLKKEVLPYNTVRLGVEGGVFYLLFIGLYYFSGVYGLFKIIYAYPNSRGEFRNQLNYLLLASLVAFSASFVYFPSLFGVEIPPVDNLILSFYTLLIFYAITKHELMDIRVAISRTAAYGFVGALIIASFASLYLFPLNVPLALLLGAVLALFWAWAAHRLREIIQTPLVEKWITGWYSPEKLINSISLKLVPVLERKEAFEIVANELKNTIKIKNIEILVGDHAPKTGEIKRAGKAMEIPFSSTEGVEGAIKLSEKTSEDPYDEKDLRLFQTLQVQLLAILDRIRPYEEVKQRLIAAQVQIERSQRLASLGKIIQEVGHEIRNPLAALSSCAQDLKANAANPKFIGEASELIVKKCNQVEKVIKMMYGASQEPKFEPEKVNIKEPIESALRFLPSREEIEINKEFNPVPAVWGDRDELERAFTCLFTNAYDALSEKGGKLIIQTAVINRGKDKYVKIEVADTGCGIAKENLSQIFEYFYTTKFGQIAERIGFGLPIVHKIIVEHHHGTIQVESAPGKGTRFTITLPTGD